MSVAEGPQRAVEETATDSGKYAYPCPSCGQTTYANAKHHVRQQTPCRACVRLRNGWTCGCCGSSDPHHPSPCSVSAPAGTPAHADAGLSTTTDTAQEGR